MNRKLAKKMAQSRDCSCVSGKDRDNNYNSVIDKIFDWHESEVEKLNLYGVMWSKSGLQVPNPDSVEYIIRRFSKNSKALDIEGRNLIYAQLGDTHHGCQCNLNGGDERHGKITSKLKQICDLFTEIDELNRL